MKNYIRLNYMIIFLLILSFAGLEAKTKEEIKRELLYHHSHSKNSSGRLFYLAWPLNDSKQQPGQALEIYVTSSVNTTVTLTNDNLGVSITKNVNTRDITTFTTNDGSASFDWEILDSERPLGLGFKLSSPDPISVYVMNSKSVSSEGYLGIPVTNWGNKYIHNSFYDFQEFRDWASGMCIIASENNTKVRIQLRDALNNDAVFGFTKRGKKAGDVWTVTLQKGEVYVIEGQGVTRGIFDMSGSIITADKPFGLLSFHNRCMIPAQVITSGRDYLIEMMPPVQAWGTQYHTVELARGFDKGDYFRVVAAEPNTTVDVIWYDKNNGAVLGNNQVLLKKEGDIWSYNEANVQWPHQVESIRGVSSFMADKPILVMQYAYSANYDPATKYDPFMFLVTPVEQYTMETIFQTPSNSSGNNDFAENWFNLIAIGDPEDTQRNNELLSSIKLDGVAVSDLQGTFLGNNIPGTNLYWAFLIVQQGRHEIVGNTPFGGYIYGFARFDSYGWPAATAFRNLGEIDTLAPIVEFPPACNEWLVKVVDDPEHERNGKEGDDPIQRDVGVEIFPMLMPGSFNFKEPVYTDKDGRPLAKQWEAVPANYEFFYTIAVDDIYSDARANIRVFDGADNVTDTTIIYYADSLMIDPEPLSFGDVRLNNTKEIDVTVTSYSDETITITDIGLFLGAVYEISEAPNTPFELEARESFELKIAYTPIQEYTELEEEMDLDSLIITTECLEWRWPIDGRGVEPKIIAGDYDAGLVKLGEFVTSDQRQRPYVRISNPGTMDLEVTGLEFPADRKGFSLPNATDIAGNTVTFATPIIVKPKQEIDLGHLIDPEHLIRFEPVSTGTSEIEVNYISNAFGPDPLSIWKGSAISSGVVVEGYNFEPTRVNLLSDEIGYVTVWNFLPDGVTDPEEGETVQIRVEDIVLENAGDVNFSLNLANGVRVYDVNDNLINPNRVGVIDLKPEGTPAPGIVKIEIPVRFRPSAEAIFSNNVVINFISDREPVSGLVTGKGFIPKVNITNYEFQGPVKINEGPHTTAGQPTVGLIEIQNISQDFDEVNPHFIDLVISSVEIDGNSPDADQFYLIPKDATDGDEIIGIDPNGELTNFPLTIPQGEKAYIKVGFNPTGVYTKRDVIMKFRIINDAGPAEDDGGAGRIPQTVNNYGIETNGFTTADLIDGGYVMGEIEAVGLDVTNADFGTVSLCDIENQTVTVTNNNTDDAAAVILIGHNPVGDAGTYYEFLSPIGGEIAPNGGTGTLEIGYKSGVGEMPQKEWELIYQRVDNDEITTLTFIINGNFRTNILDISLPNYTNPKITPGQTTGKQGVANYDVTINANIPAGVSAAEYWSELDVRSMSVTLKYKESWLFYNNNVAIGNAANGWAVTANPTEVIPGPEPEGKQWLRQTFVLTGGNRLNGNGVLFTPEFIFLLTEETEYTVEIESVEFGERDLCVNPNPTPGTIVPEFCIQDLRPIIVNLNQNGQMSKPINPNPITGDEFEFKYLIATESNVEFSITNSNGEFVKTVFNGRLASGDYTSLINVSDLSSGVYYLNFKYLGVDETQKLVIVR